ncbi:LytTR family transcriptional regulator DNA-binding domain-containing protein [Paenibacillus elgii]|uniref:LytTR family transcriptional regulator DNA-binding domain-containing protein n=1 Tax=Paenibacillus elgii TaxID=189691 RepID=UPI00203B1C26|nr:LytTR family transcriptional regulator DNA-binding domain-containing protein [Paenibacillus elgii]MCM3273077.1 LytTR family transcriptional regulator DNA-binding domain-containing protein [Paenibacillus elgii]
MGLDRYVLPVVNLTTNEFMKISLADVEKITKDNRDRTIYHIGGTEYMQIKTLDEHAEYLYEMGLRDLDKSNVVNLNKVESIDKELRNICFDESKQRLGFVASHKVKYVNLILQAMRENRDVAEVDKEFVDKHRNNKLMKNFIDFLERKHKKT